MKRYLPIAMITSLMLLTNLTACSDDTDPTASSPPHESTADTGIVENSVDASPAHESTAPSCPDDVPPDGLVVVAASHANVPMLRLSNCNAKLAGQVLDAGGEIRVISADGTPENADINIPKVEGNNETTRAKSRREALKKLNAAVTVLPNADEVSAYRGMRIALDEAADMAGVRRPAIICLGCGLDTTGPLDMTTENALLNEPTDIVEHLTASNQLVDFTDRFDEVTVHLTAMGYVAGPQEELSESDRTGLVAIWTAVLEAGGATVADPHGTLNGDPIDTKYTVTPVKPSRPSPPPPPPPPCNAQQHTFDGASGARFVAETDQWVDVSEARASLQPLATWLAEDPARTASIQGTTARIHSGRPDEGVELSRSRAEAAKTLIVELGAKPEQIVSIKGLGPNYPGYVTDHDKDGNPVPHLRAKNRKVIVTLDAPCPHQ